MLEGFLPWSDMQEAEAIANTKLNVTFQELGRSLPLEMNDFIIHLEKLKFPEMPNYVLLDEILKKCQPADVTDDMPYDWEDKSRRRRSRHSKSLIPAHTI